MRLSLIVATLVLGMMVISGCVQHAADVSQQLKMGMSETQVTGMLGLPMFKKIIRFQGHTEDYLVYEYELVPDVPV